MDWVEFARRRQEAPAIRRVPLCADGSLLVALDAARTSRDPERIAAAEAAVTEATIVVDVRALPGVDFTALRDAHRPTDEQAEQGMAWNPDTFPRALVAACIVDGPTDIDAWFDTLTIAEQQQLINTALIVNSTAPDLGFTVPGTA